VLSLVVVMLFSESPRRDVGFLVLLFGLIIFIPVWAMRTPAPPGEKKAWRWHWRWFRRRSRTRNARQRMYWRRKRHQSHHQPFGTPERTASTFVAAPRKPTGP
jgi:hypothetical protein